MNINSNIYNHLSSSLAPKKRNTTHKSSELKAVYNNMSRYNKKSPLYLFSLSESKQEHMINIKEAALTLRDVADNFANSNSEIYSQKAFHSDNTQAVTGAFRHNSISSLPEEIKLEISSLATEQINIGNYIRYNDSTLYSKEHKFTLDTINSSAHFNISVTQNDSNLAVQKKLAQYINNRNLGINASVLTDGNTSAIMLSSEETGSPATDDGLYFSFRSDSTGQNIVDVLGLNNTTTYPSNSRFKINGDDHTSTSNHISINQVIELDFHEVTASPVNISFITDTVPAVNQIDSFINAYNSLVDLSAATQTTSIGSRNLSQDISIIADNHKIELELAGLYIDDEGHITKNEDIFASSLANGKLAGLFSDESTFRSDIFHATNRLTVDPMAYINKLIVTYPNSQNKLNTAYTQSVYSGLIYNNYA